MPGPRIAILTTGLARGGAETQVVLLASGLKRRGWIVRLYSMLPPRAFSSRLEEEGIPVACLGMRPGVPDPRAILSLVRQLRPFKPHLTHSHMVHANLLGRIACMAVPKSALVCTAHSIREGGWLRELAYRVSDPFCDLTTNVSRSGLTRYLAQKLISPDKAMWVPNGVDISYFAPDPGQGRRTRERMGWGDRFVWMAVGNLREPKDYPNLLKALTRVVTVHPRVLLPVAGCGPLLSVLESRVRDLGLGGHVQFLGVRDDVRDLLRAADAYVLSSAWEGTPMALLEASSSGLPSVATSVGGNPDVIENCQTGFLVPPKDPDALARHMLRLMALPPGVRAGMGAAARRRVETTFSHEKILDKWENIYEQLIQTACDRPTSRQ